MDAGFGKNEISGALSVLGWWAEAGVDTIVSDAPADWLKRAEPSTAALPAAPPAPAAPAAAPFPATLDAFRLWLAEGDDVPEAQWGPARIAAAGDPASGLMIVGDLPDVGDAEAGRLYSGPIGELFDKMMTAIKRSRDSIYLVPFASVRPPGGLIDPAARERLAAIALHHAWLVRPKRLLLMGEAPTRALLKTELRAARGTLHGLNHDGATIETVATFRPRFLHERPAAKGEAWKDLQLLMEGLGA